MILRLLILFSLFLGSSSAYAADTGGTWNWSGPYLGAHISAAKVKTDYRSDFRVIGPDTYSDSAAGIGFHAGYGRTIGRVYLGAEADFQVFGGAESHDAGQRFSGSIVGSPFGGTIRTNVGRFEAFESELRATGSLKARLGFPVGRFLPYVSAGVAAGNIETRHLHLTVIEQRISGRPATRTAEGEFARTSGVDIGYTVGGGAAVAITPRVSFRAEYAFTDLGERSFDLANGQGEVAFDTRSHDVKLGVSLRF